MGGRGIWTSRGTSLAFAKILAGLGWAALPEERLAWRSSPCSLKTRLPTRDTGPVPTRGTGAAATSAASSSRQPSPAPRSSAPSRKHLAGIRDSHQRQLPGVKAPFSAPCKPSVKTFLKATTSGKGLLPPGRWHWLPWERGSFQWVYTAPGEELREGGKCFSLGAPF